MGLKKACSYHFFLVNIRLCPHQVAPPVKIMPRPFFHERGIASGTTSGKVPMAKMITVKDLIIISHSYCFFLMKNGMQVKLPLKSCIFEFPIYWIRQVLGLEHSTLFPRVVVMVELVSKFWILLIIRFNIN